MTGLLALSLVALGCSTRALDLDIPTFEASNEPGVLAIVREMVAQLAVDEQRLYWSGERLGLVGPDNFFVLHSCLKRDCAATLVTYYAEQSWAGMPPIFSVQGGQIYWYRQESSELLACAVAGCIGSPRSVVATLSFNVAAFGDDQFYFAVKTGFRRYSLYGASLSQPGVPKVIAYSADPVAAAGQSADALVLAIATDAANVYWLSVGDGESDSKLMRTRKDGASAIEIVTTDLRFSRFFGIGMTTDETAIYWTNNQLAGAIKRCPVAGCAESSDVIAPLRAPRGLQIDGSELYYLYEAEPFQYTLASCSLPACATPRELAVGLDETSVAIDDQYVYVATTEQHLSTDTTYVPTGARLRRLPKPDGALP